MESVEEIPQEREQHQHGRMGHYLGRVALGVGGAGLVLGGGVLGTQVAPHTTSIDGINITSRITPNIYEAGKITTQTPFGSFDVDSNYSFVPGIEVRPEITPQGATQFNQWFSRINNPRSRNEVLSTIVDDQTTNLAWRFGIGAGASALALAAAYELSKKRHDRSFKHALVAGSVGVIVGMTEMVGTGMAYHDSNVTTLHATGLLAQALSTPGQLRTIDSIQANEVMPYLNGWVSLGKLAQAKIAAPEKETPTVLNLLFVSDIHGRNRYALMQAIIKEQLINAVVDEGDLINFGFPQELALTHLQQGVKSLKIPYLYVTGNHDSLGPNDFSVISALVRGAPNVIPLQPNATTYNEVSVGGYTIAGMNDQGHYYTDNINNETVSMQTPYVQRMEKAFAGRLLDLVVAHEPDAMSQLHLSPFTANGHTHRAGLTGNNINAGTFTGGDELRSSGSYTDALAQFLQCKSQVKSTESCTPPSEKPSSYAILSIGEDCRPNTLTIYQYTIQNGRIANNVVTAYDLSSRTNPGTGRSCTIQQGVSVQSIPGIQ